MNNDVQRAQLEPISPDREDDVNLTETLLAVITRRRWWILLPSCGVALATIFVVRLLPDRYESEAILMRYQPVSQGYIIGANPMVTNAEAVETSTREVLSRAKLLGIISQCGLYAKERQKGITPEELTKLMRGFIKVETLDPLRPQSDASAFKISFTAEKPDIAQNVVDRLAQVFVDANVKTRENRAERTTKFLKQQVEAARSKLLDQEQRLRSFKAQYLGELPEQQQVNLLTVAELRTQLQNTVGNLGRAQQQRTSLDSSLSSSLIRLKSERSALLSRYTARHQEVLKKDQEIAGVEAAQRRLRGASAPGDPQNLALSEDPALAEVVKQVEGNGREMENLSKEEARLRTEMAQYQNRLNLTPVREQQLTGLLRDYELFRQDYTTLLNKQLQSELAGTLEERGEGLQFRLIDPPSLPVVPSSPKRVKLSLGGLAGGIVLGFVLAFARHKVDGSFYSEKALRELIPLPLVVGVPMLLTPAEDGSRTRHRRVEWAAACVLTGAVAAAEYYVFRHS